MSKKIDLTGKAFGFLTAIAVDKHETKRMGKGTYWKCVCSCGQKKSVRSDHLTGRRTRSCGHCSRRTVAFYHQRTYHIWDSMKQRCFNKNNLGFKNYGGRGITVCERWLKFENFLADMGDSPKGMTIGRINNDRGYSPGNCKWETYREQNRNTSRNVLVLYMGKEMTLKELSEITGIPYGRLRHRIVELSWPTNKAVSLPPYSRLRG